MYLRVFCWLGYWLLLTSPTVCITERDETTTESSDHNATSFTEVDKRVKRRLLMGNNCINAQIPLLLPIVTYTALK